MNEQYHFCWNATNTVASRVAKPEQTHYSEDLDVDSDTVDGEALREDELLPECDCPWGSTDCGCGSKDGKCRCDLCTGRADANVRYQYGLPPEKLRCFVKHSGLQGSLLMAALRAAYPICDIEVDVFQGGAEADTIEDEPAVNSPYYDDIEAIRREVLGSMAE